MTVISQTGKPIVALARIVSFSFNNDATASYQIEYLPSEAVFNGSEHDGEFGTQFPAHVSIDMTDSEIEAALRQATADFMSNRYNAQFEPSDIRGLKI